jgi:phosphate transport system permease protein
MSKKQQDFLFYSLGLLALLLGLSLLMTLITQLALQGWERLSVDFLREFPSRHPHKAGILSAWVGSLAVLCVTGFCSLLVGVLTGVYLEEYAPKNTLTFLIELTIINMAGIPSITFGLMALGFFVHGFGFGESILTAGLTLSLLVLPIIIVTTREALKTIPVSLKEGVYSLGASPYQVIRDHLIPYASGGILTGMILALSRAVGETAPLITIGALTFIGFLPSSPVQEEFPYLNFQWLFDSFTVLPIQMFNWLSRPQEAFHHNAAATGLILLILTVALNLLAQIIRYRCKRFHTSSRG